MNEGHQASGSVWWGNFNSPAPPRETVSRAVLAATILTLLNVLLYRKVIRLWWTYDDPNILRLMFDHPFWATFTSSSVWPQQLFTPLMITAFEGQYALFGLDPQRWYVIHLALASISSIAVYAAARQFLPAAASLSAAALFAAGVPFCSIVVQLSTVHYFVAIILMALSLIAWVRGMRSGSLSGPILSALFYLAGLLAKEVAVSLPLLLLALPAGTMRRRLQAISTHAIAVGVYFAWRYSVLGTFLGAYGWKIELHEWPGLLLRFPWRVIQAAAGVNVALGLSLVTIVAVVIAFALRNRYRMALLAIALVVVLGPILPVAKEVNRRYVVVPWLGAAVAFAAAASTLKDRRLEKALLIAVPLFAVVVNRQEWAHEYEVRRQMSAEGRFFFESAAGMLLREPKTPPAVMGELQWLRTIHLGQKETGSWFYDDILLCSNGAEGKKVWEYDEMARQVVEITRRLPRLAASHCGSIRPKAPLTVAFRYEKPALHWSLGPYEQGQYRAVLGNGIQGFDIPREDALNLPGATGLTLRIRYDSPEGWTTYSPELQLDFAKQPDVIWRR